MKVKIDKILGRAREKDETTPVIPPDPLPPSDNYQYWNLKGIVDNIQFGGLYNWFAITDARGIAPAGWHVPNHVELITLLTNASSDGYKYCKISPLWIRQYFDPEPTNITMFSALPSGHRSSQGLFSGGLFEIASIADDGNFTRYGTIQLNYMQYSITSVPKRDGRAVRFIKNTSSWNPGDSVSDYDGNVYQTTKIGQQVWTTENYYGEHFNNGDAIPIVTENAAWEALVTPGMCYFENNKNYASELLVNIQVHSKDLITFKDTTSVKWNINAVSDTEIEIEASSPDNSILELFAANETELLACWSLARASANAARINIVGPVTFTATREFLIEAGEAEISMVGYPQNLFNFATYRVNFSRVTIENIDFINDPTNLTYLWVKEGRIKLRNVNFIAEKVYVADMAVMKTHVQCYSAAHAATGRVEINGVGHTSQTTAENETADIQPLIIRNSGTGYTRLFISLLNVNSELEFARFSRLYLDASVSTPYLVTGDTSWFYHPTQQMAGAGNIHATSKLLKCFSIDNARMDLTPEDATLSNFIGRDATNNLKYIGVINLLNGLQTFANNSDALSANLQDGDFYIQFDINAMNPKPDPFISRIWL